MSVRLVPDKTIHFHGPLTQSTRRTLTIINENAAPVAFKILSNAPKLYNVRPPQGRIGPGDSLEVTIIWLAIEIQTPLSAGRLDKFLIRSTFITSENFEPPWYASGAADDDQAVYSQKITARFQEAESTGHDDISDPTAVSTESTHLPSASLVAEPSTPLQSDRPDRDESRNDFRRPPGSDVKPDPEGPSPPTPGLTVRGKQDLEQQLSDAQEEIRYLRALLARSSEGTSTVTDTATRTSTSTPKSLASGVEAMMAALRNFVHPLASSHLLDGAQS